MRWKHRRHIPRCRFVVAKGSAAQYTTGPVRHTQECNITLTTSYLCFLSQISFYSSFFCFYPVHCRYRSSTLKGSCVSLQGHSFRKIRDCRDRRFHLIDLFVYNHQRNQIQLVFNTGANDLLSAPRSAQPANSSVRVHSPQSVPDFSDTASNSIEERPKPLVSVSTNLSRRWFGLGSRTSAHPLIPTSPMSQPSIPPKNPASSLSLPISASIPYKAPIRTPGIT